MRTIWIRPETLERIKAASLTGELRGRIVPHIGGYLIEVHEDTYQALEHLRTSQMTHDDAVQLILKIYEDL